MALLHPQSSESIDTGLDLFEIPPTQTSVSDGMYMEQQPISSFTLGSPIEFLISGATEDYLDLHNTLLHIKAKITQSDGSDLANDEEATPTNYWLHSMFQQCDIYLNDTLITASENTYPYRAMIETLTMTDHEAQTNGFLTSSMFYRDPKGVLGATQSANNAALAIRKGLTARSRTVDMIGKIHSDITRQLRFLIPGVDVKIKLIPSKSAFNLMVHTVANANKTEIVHASLFVRKVKVNPAVALAHEKMLLRSTVKYPIKRSVNKVFSIPLGQLSYIQDNLFLSQTPTKLFIVFVDTSAFNGVYNENPFNFKHHNITYLSLYMDGKQIPSKPFTPDFATNQYVRSYYSMLAASGVTNGSSNGISYQDFGDGYTIFGFDLSPSLVDNDQFELVRSGAIHHPFGS